MNKDVGYVYDGLVFSHNKKGNPAIYDSLENLEVIILNLIRKTEKDK